MTYENQIRRLNEQLIMTCYPCASVLSYCVHGRGIREQIDTLRRMERQAQMQEVYAASIPPSMIGASVFNGDINSINPALGTVWAEGTVWNVRSEVRDAIPLTIISGTMSVLKNRRKLLLLL